MKDLQDQIRSATTYIESVLRKHCIYCSTPAVAVLIRGQLLKIEQSLKEYAERGDVP